MAATISARRYNLTDEQHIRLRRESRRLFRRGKLRGTYQALTPERAASELLRRIVDYGLARIDDVLSDAERR